MNNRLVKKYVVLLVSAAMVCSALAGCGSSDTSEESSEEEEEEPSVGGDTVVNPMTESDEDSIKDLTGASFTIPEDAQDPQYFIYNDEMGEVQFTLNGSTKMNFRVARESEFTDISGLYCEWGSELAGTLGNCEEKDYGYHGDDGDAQLCLWYDADNGVMYSLSAQDDDLDGFDIVGYAMQMTGSGYDPEQEAVNGQDMMEYISGKYVICYDPEYFMAFDGVGEYDVDLSFNNDDVQIAGSNVISVTFEENTTAEDVIKGYMDQYGAGEDEMTENTLGGEDNMGYSYSTGNLCAEGSELVTCDTFYAVPRDNDVVLIHLMRTVGPDTDTENLIDEKMSESVATFQLFYPEDEK